MQSDADWMKIDAFCLSEGRFCTYLNVFFFNTFSLSVQVRKFANSYYSKNCLMGFVPVLYLVGNLSYPKVQVKCLEESWLKLKCNVDAMLSLLKPEIIVGMYFNFTLIYCGIKQVACNKILSSDMRTEAQWLYLKQRFRNEDEKNAIFPTAFL